MQLRRVGTVLLVAILMLVVAAVPVMAQGDDKAARKAARQAAKAQKAQAKDAPKKATPSTGGTPVSSVALLGVGTLLVGGGLVAARVARR
jgi:LPXTG-motif cell wall-anchored protein